jgi:tol-pal system protein YbgF
MRRNSGPSLGAAFLAALIICAPAFAQQAGQGGAGTPQQGQPSAAAGAPVAAAQSGGDAALKQRVEQLEEQLVDMQVVVGTLESLARGGVSAAVSAPRGSDGSGGVSGSADDLRIEGLETQVRALAAQLQQLTAEVRALSASGPRRADAGAVTPPAAPPGADPSTAAESPSERFGSTTVTAGTKDAIGGLIESDGSAKTPPASAPPSAPSNPPAQDLAAAPPAFMPPPTAAADADNPKQLYETAYGYLMQRDYGAAQSAFEQFLNRYPKDSLAGNAQYWLGEAHFVRGEYKAAAGAFLKGYQSYSGNARAADSLLKLAMSLDRLGQKEAACSSFSELSTRFPDAPDNVKSRAKTERQRIGCR